MIVVLLMLTGSVQAVTPGCAQNIQQLRELVGDARFSPKWKETTMNDGKPMLVEIVNGKQGLLMRFVKTGEGMWAEGTAQICQSKKGLTATIRKEDIRVGEAAHWAMKRGLEDGEEFFLEYQPGRLKISTGGIFGWSGIFVPDL